MDDSQADTVVNTPTHYTRPRGFLPIDTNWFDRLFIGIIGHVLINLLWMRLLEQSIPLLIGTILGVIWIVVTMKWG